MLNISYGLYGVRMFVIAWSEYIRGLGPMAVLFMFFLLLGFCGVFLGTLEFRWHDKD